MLTNIHLPSALAKQSTRSSRPSKASWLPCMLTGERSFYIAMRCYATLVAAAVDVGLVLAKVPSKTNCQKEASKLSSSSSI